MKMKKLSFVLCSATLFALAACDDTTNTPTEPGGPYPPACDETQGNCPDDREPGPGEAHE